MCDQKSELAGTSPSLLNQRGTEGSLGRNRGGVVNQTSCVMKH